MTGCPGCSEPAAAALSSALSGLVAQVGLEGSLPGLWSPCVSPESSRLALPLQGVAGRQALFKALASIFTCPLDKETQGSGC